jgi:hypothetical protein
MKPKTELQFQREIRRLKMELKKRDLENQQLEKTNRRMTAELETNKDEIQACEDRISELERKT